MTQDKKKDKIFHTEKGTYVRRLMNISPSAHEHMFVGLRTYVHEKAMQIACPGRPMSPFGMHLESAWDGHYTKKMAVR